MSEPTRVADTAMFRALQAALVDHGVTPCPHCRQPHDVWGCFGTSVAWPTRCDCCAAIMKWVEAA